MVLRVMLFFVLAVWIISEFLLAIAKRSQIKTAKELDRHSLILLWITIMTCIPVGVFLGVRGIGQTGLKSHILPVTGLVFIGLGLVLRWTAILTLQKYFTVNVSVLRNHQLITTGIYKIVRHPAYVGSLLSFLGLGLIFSNWLSTLVIFVPMLAAFIYRIQIEEKALIQYFGQKYDDYRASTKRLIPKIY